MEEERVTSQLLMSSRGVVKKNREGLVPGATTPGVWVPLKEERNKTKRNHTCF